MVPSFPGHHRRERAFARGRTVRGQLGLFTVRVAVTTGQTKQPATPVGGAVKVAPGTAVYLTYTHPLPLGCGQPARLHTGTRTSDRGRCAPPHAPLAHRVMARRAQLVDKTVDHSV